MSNLPEHWLTNAAIVDMVLANASGGLGRNGEVFPPRLVAYVLKVIKRKVLDPRVVSAVELESGGPTAELPELWNQPDYKEYWTMSMVYSWTRIWCVKRGVLSLIGSRRKKCTTIVPGQRPRRRVSNPFF